MTKTNEKATLDQITYSRDLEAQMFFREAELHLKLGRTDLAFGHIRNGLYERPNDPQGLILLAQAFFAKSEYIACVEAITNLHKVAPPTAQSSYIMAAAYGHLGKIKEVLKEVSHSLSLEADQPSAQSLLANAYLRAPHYQHVLQGLHKNWRDEVGPIKRYLEIGVFKGHTLKLAAQAETVIGVDPDVHKACIIPDNATLVPVTSDAFFDDQCPKEPFDMTFVDGLHVAGQVYRDLVNAYQVTRPGGLIGVHDVCPVHEAVQRPDRSTSFWTGDVWKGYLAFTEMLEGSAHKVVPAPPSGLGVIKVGMDKSFLPKSSAIDEAIIALEKQQFDNKLAEKLGAKLGVKQSLADVMADVQALKATM